MTHYYYDNYNDSNDKNYSKIFISIIVILLLLLSSYLIYQLYFKQDNISVYVYPYDNPNQDDINQAAIELYEDYLYYNNKN